MMNLALCTLITAVALASTTTIAQGKRPKEYRRAQTYANVQSAAEGKVLRLLISPTGDVDGLLLDGGAIVTFPGHMGDALAAAVKPGDAVVVKGYHEVPSQIKGYVITNTSSNQTVTTLPKPRSRFGLPKFFRNLGLKEMTAQGEVRHLRFGKKGEANGLILADGTIVRFKREALYQFGGLIQIGRRLAARGYGAENQFGRAFEATALAEEGQALQPIYRR